MAVPCPHWWMIETPHGPTATGICKRCGAIREFFSSLSDPDFSPSNKAKRQRRQLVLTEPDESRRERTYVVD